MSATTTSSYRNGQVLYMALELSAKKWVVGFSTGPGRDARVRSVEARDLAGLSEEVRRAREKFGLPDGTPVVSCYEAGRDGFWLHRCLESFGVSNVIIDPASIEQNRRRKHVKTDRIDARKMIRLLFRFHSGEKDVFRLVCVPSEDDEDRRHLHRELKTLKGDRTRIINRLRAILAQLGLNSNVPLNKTFSEWMENVTIWNGRETPSGARARLERLFSRLQRCDEEIAELEGERRKQVRREDSPQAEMVRKLLGIKAIGETTSWLLVFEIFGWRTFANRRQLGNFTGLVNAPYHSGDSKYDQGITKAGNKWLRSVIIEVAWRWLLYQPQSELSQWFERRFGRSGKRARKIGIVALARKLVIELWRYLKTGIPPAGAMLVPWYTKVRLRKDPLIA